MPRYIRLFAAILYRVCYKIHHKLFLRPQKPLVHAKIIIVGSYRIGGAGKTPFVIWLANRIATTGARVAVLCHKVAWDEHLMMKKKIPNATILLTGNRYNSARQIDQDFDYIICDDGFEDTRFTSAIKISLDWQRKTNSIQDLWPLGLNRSLEKDHTDISLHLNCHTQHPDISFYIAKIENSSHQPPPPNATLICGLGNPHRFKQDIEKNGYKVSSAIFRKDHDRHFSHFIAKAICHGQKVILSEKDLYRLPQDFLNDANLFVCHQAISINSDILDAIDSICQ